MLQRHHSDQRQTYAEQFSAAGDGAAGACSVVIAARAKNKGAKKQSGAVDAAGQNTRPPSMPLQRGDLAHCSTVPTQERNRNRQRRGSTGANTAPHMKRGSMDARAAARGGTRDGSPRAAGFATEETDGGEHLYEDEVGFLLGQPAPSGKFAAHQRKVLGNGVAGAELRVSTCSPMCPAYNPLLRHTPTP